MLRRISLALLSMTAVLALAASPAAAAGVSLPGRYAGAEAFTVGGVRYEELSKTPYRGSTFGYYQDRRVSSGFGSYRSGHPHSGTDFAIPEWTTLYAPFSGSVVTVSYDQVFGNYVLLRSTAGRLALFGHLASASVDAGSTVRVGARLGYSGNTGSSTGPHLHLTMWNPSGQLCDALTWLKRTKAPLFYRAAPRSA